ncbi:alkaline phosphatase family protein [Flavobacterium sp. MDT1-60]|uniref:LamG-like jellyroll fold domain-containing protein n=1 Tax=Flavobacterium sp. MDT1-60 TaxID=1979344 RepID=UPI00177C71B3|nr:alkaline phosphatase family protein [Flavobacterium sp. MDT1-60]QOG02902.1 alkaline phosphatase family protein [Flavobacterium sp. MDT1-60]
MKKKFIFILVLTVILNVQSQARKVLFIGIDGCRADVLTAANTPAIDDLLTHAVYSTDGLCAYKTWSGNGWSTMLSGVWHTKHGVSDNTFSGANFTNYPDFISRIETFNSSLKTISCVHWGPINTTIIQNANIKNTYATDLEVKNGAVLALTNDNPDVLFVAFDDVDHAGHTYGFASTIPQYVSTIETTDSYVAAVIAAMKSRPNYANEDWLVVVTTDHGGNLAGHGGGTIEERTIFNIYSNPNFTTQQLSKTVVSNAATFNESRFVATSFAKPVNQTPFSFGTTQDFTIEFWVKANNYTGDPALISNKNWGGGANAGFVISAQSGKFWKVNVGDGTDRIDIEGGNLQPGVWHHLAVSFDRDGLMTAYEDGAVVGYEKMQNINSINSGLPFVINQDGTTTYSLKFDGSYRDIRVWNSVIPNDVLVEWATKPVSSGHPFYSQLLANYKCDETAGTTLTDSSANGNNATITGSVTRQTDQSNTFAVNDYAATTREPDNAVTALNWMCVPIQPAWSLDGKNHVALCETLPPPPPVYNVVLFPNPTSSLLNVTFESPDPSATLKITKVTNGQLVLQKTLFSTTGLYQDQINVSSYKRGIYVVTIQDSRGSESKNFSRN